jgi:hypothetical protein
MSPPPYRTGEWTGSLSLKAEWTANPSPAAIATAAMMTVRERNEPLSALVVAGEGDCMARGIGLAATVAATDALRGALAFTSAAPAGGTDQAIASSTATAPATGRADDTKLRLTVNLPRRRVLVAAAVGGRIGRVFTGVYVRAWVLRRKAATHVPELKWGFSKWI